MVKILGTQKQKVGLFLSRFSFIKARVKETEDIKFHMQVSPP